MQDFCMFLKYFMDLDTMQIFFQQSLNNKTEKEVNFRIRFKKFQKNLNNSKIFRKPYKKFEFILL